jgi:hypothetical protein
MDYSVIGIILYCLGLVILITVFIGGRYTNTKLKSSDYGLQVTLPNVIGLVVLLIGSFIVFKGADDLFFVTIIPITAIGGIYISLISIMNSAYIMRWQGS